jgi:hypothetical protein
MEKKTRGTLIFCLCFFGLMGLLYLSFIANGTTLQVNAPRLLFNRYTIPPFRSVLEHSGKIVTWNERARQLTIQKGTDSFNLEIDTGSDRGIPVYVDNDYIGKSPVYKKLPAGKYLVTTKPPHNVGSIRYLTLKSDQTKEQKIALPVDHHSYQEFLDEILKLGYKPIRVMDYYNHVPITKKTIVLRHDVDVSADYALKMAQIEHAKGVKSTYYFRWCSVDAKTIKAIRDMGDEVGLHYETLASYAEERHLNSAQEITPEVTAELRRRLKVEIADFKRQFGDVYTISSHGAEKNNDLGVTNYRAIMEGQNALDYGIIGDAYGEILKHFTYMSDAGGIWEPFPYPKIENDQGPFYILIHPIHWAASYHS